MYKGNIIHLMLLFFVFNGIQSDACTSFQFGYKKQLVVGKNLDWDFDQGLVIHNKRNLAKKAWLSQDEMAVTWISKYGSITFNHLGKEFPLGGMNEKGLVVEEMNYWDTEYPKRDKRKAINELQWIQYQLDNSKNVDEVIASDTIIRIAKYLFKIHYLVADAEGNSAIIEFSKGKIRTYRSNNYPITVLANNAYETSIKMFPNFEGFGGEIPIDQKYYNRFPRAWKMIQDYKGSKPIVDYSFDILESIKELSDTKWSIVYDPINLKIYFKTKSQSKIKDLSLLAFDFSCTSTDLCLNINFNNEGYINNYFVKYRTSTNMKLLEDIYKDFAQAGLISIAFADSIIPRQTKYLEECYCSEKKKLK